MSSFCLATRADSKRAIYFVSIWMPAPLYSFDLLGTVELISVTFRFPTIYCRYQSGRLDNVGHSLYEFTGELHRTNFTGLRPTVRGGGNTPKLSSVSQGAPKIVFGAAHIGNGGSHSKKTIGGKSVI